MPDNATAARKDAAMLKASRTLDLRMAGASFAQIATALGYGDRSSARKAYLRALDADVSIKAEDRDAWRQEQAARCDRLILSLWQSATVDKDPKAHAAISRHMDRQAKLLGLDAPTRLIVDDALTAEIESLLDQMSELPGPSIAPVVLP